MLISKKQKYKMLCIYSKMKQMCADTASYSRKQEMSTHQNSSDY